MENIQMNPLDIVDTTQIDTLLGTLETPQSIGFGDLVIRAITGQLDLSPQGILTSIVRYVFSEIFLHIGLMQQLIFVAILAALLKILTDSFNTKSSGELGFYICYIALVTIMFSSFRIAIVIATDMIQSVTQFVQVSVPVVISLVLMSGNVTGAYVYNSLLIFAINIINTVVVYIVMPLIAFVTTIQVINYITENEILSNMSGLVNKAVSLGTKSLAVGFISILALQRVSAPIINNLAIRGTRSAIGATPIVGGVLTGAMDTVLYFASATKSGVIVAVIIVIFYLCVIPIAKLTALMFIYKFVAAIIQPICDKRIVKCINTVGNFNALLLAVSVMIAVMFSVALIMLVSF